MGIRMDQFKGLNPAAMKLIRDNEVLVYTEAITRIYPDGRIEQFLEERKETGKAKYGSFSGMFDDEYPLMEYFMKDGSKVREAIQAQPWSSGPVFFLALQDEKGEWIKETLWDEETINNC